MNLGRRSYKDELYFMKSLGKFSGGVSEIYFGNFPDQRYDILPESFDFIRSLRDFV